MIDNENRPYQEIEEPYSETLPDEEHQMMLAKTAKRFFIRASIASPASVVSQSARIAEYCHTEGDVQPVTLLQALLSSDELLREISSAATRAHTATGNGPSEVSYSDVEDIVTHDFLGAQNIMSLDQHDLDIITGPIYELSLDEDNYEVINRIIDEMLKRKKTETLHGSKQQKPETALLPGILSRIQSRLKRTI